MKLQFKYQKFQADAEKAVADVFDGQPYLAPFLYDRGNIGEKFVVEERKGTFFRMEQSEDRAKIKR